MSEKEIISDLIVVGGGAAGFFAALAAKQARPDAKVLLLEKSAVLLAKVRISGGGRCNVTHACFDPIALSKNYPRGEKELIGPFHCFQPKQTIEWFASRGVALKTEADGRMFPITDQSETIIHCLMEEAKKLDIPILLRQRIATIEKPGEEFILQMTDGTTLSTKKLLLATGSSKEGFTWAQQLGHTIQEPVPSLFTFNIPHFSLAALSGISFTSVTVQVEGAPLEQTGPLLITHFGLSGPAVLKLSAWGARFFHKKEYHYTILLNWLPDSSLQEIEARLHACKKNASSKTLFSENPFSFPKSFWKLFLERGGISCTKRLHDCSLKELESLARSLQADSYRVEGKTTHKEEFVTCGGVLLKEVQFKTMESKICPGLFFAGEILDIDGVTGGFNFQNAWTTGFIAGSSSVKYLEES